MVRTFLIALIGLGLTASLATAQEKDGDKKPAEKGAAAAEKKPMCPVMDEPIDPKVYVRYQGKRVYMCCNDCIAEFKKDPEKYAAKIKAQWDAMPAHRIQVKCPVTGAAVNSAVFVETPHMDIYFKDEDAKKAWEADKAKYEKNLDGCYTYQTTCPLSGREINPAISKEIEGKTVYFCCNGCAGKPEKVDMKKVEAQVKANEEAFKKAHPADKK